ncbi:MAG: type IV pili methyl-accepting chemotaxis transducer N-terminal domain-containing protein [Chloroflexi bacterium]|nr:type IV pili methyl-accepting chemotaxis transducer N-terminal domain-containing protein [Chloroflexota bacterium]
MLKSLQGRLTLLFVAFALLVLVSVGAMMWGLEAQRQDALVINLAGRQRMLAQQMARLAYEAGDGEDVTNASLQDIRQIFDQTLRALMDGGEAPYLSDTTVTLPLTRDFGIRTALNEVDLTWSDFRALLDKLQLTTRDDPSFAIILQSIEEKSSTLVMQADKVVRLYEADSTAKVNRLRAMQIGFLAGALMLLGVGAWLTRKSALMPLRELSQAANRLGENDLETAIQVEGPEEMRALSESFDLMRKSLRVSRSELLKLMSTLEERVAQRTRELEALNEVSREIASQLDVRVVLNSVTDKARTLLNSDSAMLCLLGERKQHLHLQAMSGLPALQVDREYMSTVNQASAVLTSHQALVCNHGQCVGGCGLLTERHAASHAVAPLRIGEKVIGALCVSSSQPNHFTNESAAVLTKLANTAAIALQNAQLYTQAEKVAALEERNRIAADMHDGLGQTLSYLGLMTDQTMEALSEKRVDAALERLHKTRETIDKTTGDLRRAINNLMDESPIEFRLCERLQDAVNEFTHETRLPVTWQAEAAPRCSRQVAEQALNVTREALKNAAHHAEAKTITVRLGRDDCHYFIAVEDDGRGFDLSQPEPNGHFGLKIMQARAAHIGGNVAIESAQGHGTRVTLSWAVEMGE